MTSNLDLYITMALSGTIDRNKFESFDEYHEKMNSLNAQWEKFHSDDTTGQELSIIFDRFLNTIKGK